MMRAGGQLGIVDPIYQGIGLPSLQASQSPDLER
jgi:hypothetical protein